MHEAREENNPVLTEVKVETISVYIYLEMITLGCLQLEQIEGDMAYYFLDDMASLTQHSVLHTHLINCL